MPLFSALRFPFVTHNALHKRPFLSRSEWNGPTEFFVMHFGPKLLIEIAKRQASFGDSAMEFVYTTPTPKGLFVQVEYDYCSGEEKGAGK